MLVLQDIGTTAKSGFLDDSDMVDEAEEDGSDEEGELFDSVCAICDNGGELLWYVFLLLFVTKWLQNNSEVLRLSSLSSSLHYILFS